MKNILLTIMLIAIAFCLPLEVSAKGKLVSAAQLKDAYGETVGRVIGMENVTKPFVLTEEGYRTAIPLPEGRVGLYIHTTDALYYEYDNCEGPAYVVSRRYTGAVYISTRNIDLAYSRGEVLYTPQDAESVTITAKSFLDNSDFNNVNCIAISGLGEVYPAYENDPIITGIENTAYPVRMVIE